MAGVWVFAEHKDLKFPRVILEMMGEGRKLADKLGEELVAVLVGKEVKDLTNLLVENGADQVLVVDEPALEKYISSTYGDLLAQLVGEYQPTMVLFANSILGRDLAPLVAEKIDTALVTDITGIEYGEELIFKRPVYAGKALQQISFINRGKPMLITIRPKVFDPPNEGAAGKGEVVLVKVPVDKLKIRQQIRDVVRKTSTRVDLTEADIVISGGRGMKGPENFKILEDMADFLGGAVGASRAAVDEGWWDHQYQVGQTGKVVSPQLYIACGISGAIQHLAGMNSSKCIVAINKDPEADIFKIADYGIVGDVFQVLPLLKEEFQKVLVDR